MTTSDDCTWPEIRQRAHYLGWLAAAVMTAGLLGLTTDLVIVAATGGEVGLGLVPLLYGSALIPPYVYAWRKHGEACCGFLELEHALDEAVRAPVNDGSALFAEVLDLIDRIERARGMERQVVRNEAKEWVRRHAGDLTPDQREYVADHLGYLHRR